MARRIFSKRKQIWRRRRYGGGRRLMRRSRFRRSFRRTQRIIKRTVRSMSEVKWGYLVVDTLFNNAVSSAFALYAFEPTISIGSSKNNRIGQRIRTKRFTIKWLVEAASQVATPQRFTLRMTFFKWRNRVPAIPANSDIYEDVGSGNGIFNSMVHTENIQVLKDYRYHMSTSYATFGGPMSAYGKLSIPWVFNWTYNDAAALTNTQDAVFMAFSAHPITDLTHTINLSIRGRMSYYDI